MRVLLVVAFTVTVTANAFAQGMPESYREVQLRMLETQRSLLIAMADSMPENLYRDKVTPIQRDFAQQIHHSAGALAFIATRYFGAEMPALPRPGATSRAGSDLNASTIWAAAGAS